MTQTDWPTCRTVTDWHAVVTRYAHVMGWELAKTQRFLSRRASLQIAAELLGQEAKSVDLRTLANYLHEQGCFVPKLHARSDWGWW